MNLLHLPRLMGAFLSPSTLLVIHTFRKSIKITKPGKKKQKRERDESFHKLFLKTETNKKSLHEKSKHSGGDI